MSHLPARIRVLSHRQAWPWRWEMALLEIGCRDGWLLPAVEVLATQAHALGEKLRLSEQPAALAFEGYTLVGACCFAYQSALVSSPQAYVMPAQLSVGLDGKLRDLVRENHITQIRTA